VVPDSPTLFSTTDTAKKNNGRNGIVEVSKNLARYKSENNFVGPLK